MPKGIDFKSFAIRETDGHDEEIAALQAKAKGGASSPSEELVRMAIVEVDGKPVAQPFATWDDWSTKTRALVLRAWTRLNTHDEKELQAFLEAGEVAEAAPRPALQACAPDGVNYGTPG